MHNVFTRSLLLASLFLALGSQSAVAGLFWEDSFEGPAPGLGGGIRNAANHANTTDGTGPSLAGCGSGDYFFRTTTTGTDGTVGITIDFSGGTPPTSGPDGITIWRGEDLDGCIANPDTIEWTGIDITGRSNLIFSGRFAARQEFAGGPFETGDLIRVESKIGGAYTTILLFQPDVPANALLEQTVPLTNTPLIQILTEFTANIPAGVGNLLDIRVTVSVDGGGEEFAFDLFQVGDDGTVPVELQSFEIE